MQQSAMSSIDHQSLTWTTLLGKWVEFAQASLASPDEADGDRWRESVTSVINLQAVTFALGDLGQLPAHERSLARDKAEMLIADAAGTLRRVWFGAPMPESLLEMLDDARATLRLSMHVGTTELRWTGSEPHIMPDTTEAITHALDACESAEDVSLGVMQPGTIIMPGEPVAWVTGPITFHIDGFDAFDVDQPRQVYRQLDQAGTITGDLVAPIETELPPGMPLLVPIMAQGERIGGFTVDAGQWLQRQRDAMHADTIPVTGLDSHTR